MMAVYWACLIGGVFYAILSVLFGDLLGDHDVPHAGEVHGDHGIDFLKPAVIVSAVTVFGGSGIMLTKYAGLAVLSATVLSIGIGVVAAVAIYFLYVRPMRNSETSQGYSMDDLVGRVGEVMTTIPEKGYGEVMLKVGAANACQIAASADNIPIASGTRVVVVQADRDTLYVTPLDIT